MKKTNNMLQNTDLKSLFCHAFPYEVIKSNHYDEKGLLYYRNFSIYMVNYQSNSIGIFLRDSYTGVINGYSDNKFIEYLSLDKYQFIPETEIINFIKDSIKND